MHVYCIGIDLEVDPIEAEGLQETEHTLAEEGVDAHFCRGLVKNGQDAVAKDQGDEGVVALDAVFDVDSRGELEVLFEILAD